jgi:hypothetical protein
MVDKAFIAYFKLAHGFFNLSMFCLFCYQGWIGLRMRKARLAGAPMPLDLVRLHRRMGPVLALLGPLGFVAGMTVVLLDKGRVFEYPLHFLAGLLIVLLIASTYAVSRKITAPGAPYRDVHFGLGMLLLLFYAVQSFLGLAILL